MSDGNGNAEISYRAAARVLPEEIHGERVVIRPYKAGDGFALWEAIDSSRESLRPWLPWVDRTRVKDDAEESARRMAARWLLREDLAVGIWLRSTGELLGGSGLHCIDWSVPKFEIGYWLKRSAEGKGYMSETVKIICRFAFETLQANRVEIRCDAHNVRSAAVARRLGFFHEATMRNHSRDACNSLRDELVFALTPGDLERTGILR